MNRFLRWAWVPALAGAIAACGWPDENELPDRKTSTPGTPDVAGDRTNVPPPQQTGHCENFSLSFGPVTLPPAVKDEPYEVALLDYAEEGWRGTDYYSSSLPEGFELVPEKGDFGKLTLRGVPTEIGKLTATVMAGHAVSSEGCSTMPDPHSFEIEVLETAPADGGTDAAPD